jgi:peptide deformylase
MIYPIVAYGDPVLKREAEEIPENFPDLKDFVANMFETMENAKGVGLAAPQIGFSVRVFIVDASPFADDDDLSEEEKIELANFRKVFINPIIVEEGGREWKFNEGCLSIPGIREDVSRKPEIVVEYYDEDFNLKEEKFTGLPARIIQHEYDHIEGILFTDRINPLRRRLLKNRLNKISQGEVSVNYKMKFPKLK